jgi:glycerol-1-phosphate dehydrogenase [NAD(P)+]
MQIARQVNIPLFLKIEENILPRTQRILEENNFKYSNPLFLYGRKEFLALGKKIFGEIPKNQLAVTDNTQRNVNRVIEKIAKDSIDAVFACGGGKVLDVGKYAATKTKINFISIPTGPSNDGIASPVAVIKNNQGLSESLGAVMPAGILCDLSVVKKAPLANIRAGIGDLLSNFSAISDWELAKKYNHEKIDDFAMSLAYTAADFVLGMCLHNHNLDIRNSDFLKKMIHGLVLSGIAMGIAGSSRPCSGSEHMISHAIDKLYPNTALHGEQVAVGAVISEKIRGGDFQKYIEIFKNLGVPHHFRQLGLSRHQMIKAILFAPKTRPGRYTIFDRVKLYKNKIEEILEY